MANYKYFTDENGRVVKSASGEDEKEFKKLKYKECDKHGKLLSKKPAKKTKK